jgi:hypothetical protein
VVCFGLGALLLAGCAGEPKRLEPAAPPPRLMPAVNLPNTPLAPNRGRVVIDTTSGPMRVTAKYDPSFTPPGGSTEQGRTGELCITPCVVDLPFGKYRLFFSPIENSGTALGDTDDLIVGEGLTVYRRAPGQYRTPSPMDQLGPAALVIAGSVAVTVGALMAAQRENSGTGTVLLIGGVVALGGGGVWAYDSSRATQQDGASTAWRVPNEH